MEGGGRHAVRGWGEVGMVTWQIGILGEVKGANDDEVEVVLNRWVWYVDDKKAKG